MQDWQWFCMCSSVLLVAGSVLSRIHSNRTDAPVNLQSSCTYQPKSRKEANLEPPPKPFLLSSIPSLAYRNVRCILLYTRLDRNVAFVHNLRAHTENGLQFCTYNWPENFFSKSKKHAEKNWHSTHSGSLKQHIWPGTSFIY